MSKLVYRVAWRREGASQVSTRIYESGDAAVRKFLRIASIEHVRERGGFEGTHLEDLPPLAGLELEQREVQPWELAPHQPQVSEYDVRAAESFAEQLRDERDAQNARAAGESIPW